MSPWLNSRPLHGRKQGKEIARKEVDVHARWKREKRAVDQKQLGSKRVLEQPMERIPNQYRSISTVGVGVGVGAGVL